MRRSTHRRPIAAAVVLIGGIGVQTVTLRAQEPRSPVLAKQLATILGKKHVEAIAVQDPADPARFIATLYIPQSELLVISAEFADPLALQTRIRNRQFRDVYVDLQSSPARKNPVFFEDLGADGLCAERSQLPDAVSDNASRTVFNGNWNQQLSREQYTAADARYSDMLTLLLQEARALP